jgi:hypothetical protein
MAEYGLKVRQSYRVCVQGESRGRADFLGLSLRIVLVGDDDSVGRFPVTSGIMCQDGRGS